MPRRSLGKWWILVALAASLPAMAALAQTGRYEGTTQAQQSFALGQNRAADGDRYLNQGDADRARRAYEEAEAAYREALGHDSNYIEAIERLAYVLYVTDRSAEAIALLEEALEAHPDELSLQRMMGINLYDSGRIDEAIALLLEVDQRAGATTDVTFILGKHYYEREDYPNAVTYFQRYLVENPADTATHGALGNAYLRTEQYDLALAEFRTVLELDPTNLAAQINIGDVYFAQLDHARAINIYLYVVERDPENVRIWFNLGKSYFEEGQFSEALGALRRVTELRPDLYQGHYTTGAALVELRRYEEGRQALSRAIALEPDHAMSHYRMGVAETHLGQLDPASRSLARAIELSPDEPWYWSALGDVYRRQRRFQDAVEQHQAAIAANAGEAVFHESLGRDLFGLNRQDEAVASFERAIELEPSSPTARQALATVLLQRVRIAIGEDRLNSAQVDLNRVTELSTHPVEVALAGAVMSMMQADLGAAQASLDTVTGNDRESLPFRRTLAHLDLLQGDPEAAGQTLGDLRDRLASELDPRDAAILGHVAARNENWERALELFQRAVDIDPVYRDAEALCHLRLGMQLAGRNRWNDASDQFRQAQDLSDGLERQDQVRILYGLGVSSLASGDYGRAQRALEQVSQQWGGLRGANRSRLPTRETARDIDLWLAYAYYRSGNYREAISRLETMPTGEGGRIAEQLLVSAHDHLARTELEQGDARAAREHFRAVLDRVPDNPITRNNYACLLYTSGEQEEAGNIFRELSESGVVASATYNYAIFLDDVAHEPEDAYRHYLRYAQTGGEETDRAREYAESKEEVFGFEPR